MKQFARQLETTEVNGLHHLTHFMRTYQLNCPEILAIGDRTTLAKLESKTEINSSVSQLLKAGVTQITEVDRLRLRDVVLGAFDQPLDDNTLKKVMVLACRLYPTDIKVVQVAIKRCRE